MDVEIAEIHDFIAGLHAFELLPKEETQRLARQIEIRYLRKGTLLMAPGDRVEFLSIVRSGALETLSPEGELLAHLDEGEAAGVRALLRGGIAINNIKAIEDTLLYQLPADTFARIRETFPAVSYHFSPQGADRLRGAKAALGSDNSALMTMRAGEMARRTPVTIGMDATVRDAAKIMAAERVSCILIVDDGRLAGVMTDRDLRNRVIAEGRSADTPIVEIMSAPPLSVPASAFLFDALLLMTRKTIHHMPIVRDGAPIGVLTSSDIMRLQTRSAVFLAGDIHKQPDAAGMARILSHVPDLIFELVESGVSAYKIGHAISALTDAATQRLVKLAEQELGPAPVAWCWLAAGSQARHEQTAKSDQDNCLLIADDYDEAKHGEWFRAFARFVNAGLDTCGYVYCPGEMMAQTDQWRQPMRVWRQYFHKWINTPEPKALMLSSVFFDMRPIAGDTALFDDLHRDVLDWAQKGRLFLAHLVANALTHSPPLGFFRNFVLIHDGEHNNTLDMKKNGIVPIVDLARLYALDAGQPTLNTQDRLEAAIEARIISNDGGRDLVDALEFLGHVRLSHQARRIRAGGKADNFISPDDLSPFERSHLRDAFTVVKAMQAAAANRYRGGMA